MSQQPGGYPPQQDEPLVGEVRVRLPLPFAVPGIALIVIAVLAIGLSRVLLSVPAEAATVIALAVAANILGACAFVALKPRVAGATYMELLAIILYPVLIGIVIANVNIGTDESHGATHAEEPAAAAGTGDEPEPGAGLTVNAENIAFDVEEIPLSANEPAAIEFINHDADRHNISIYPDQAAALAFEDAIFEGQIIGGDESVTYEFEAPEAGKYYFHCDVHPNMSGTVSVQ